MIERIASADGAHVPRCFCRQSSLSDARTETTTERWSGFSALLVLKEACSASAESAGWASMMAAFIASVGCMGTVFSERTDMVFVVSLVREGCRFTRDLL